MRAVLRTLFTSDFFKMPLQQDQSQRNFVVHLRMVGGQTCHSHYGEQIAMQPTYMGQDLLNPPSVEGWHTGKSD